MNVEFFQEPQGEQFCVGMRGHDLTLGVLLPPEQHHMAQRVVSRSESILNELRRPDSPLRQDERFKPWMKAAGIK